MKSATSRSVFTFHRDDSPSGAFAVVTLPTQSGRDSAVAPSRLVVRDPAGQVVQSWILSQPKITLGSSPDCVIHYDQPGVLPVHCIIVPGARQTFVRALGPGVTQSGVPFNEMLINATKNFFEVAGHRFDFLPAVMPQSGQTRSDSRMRFASAKQTDRDAWRADLRAGETRDERAIQLADVPWLNRLIQKTVEPLEAQIESLLLPVTDFQARVIEAEQARQTQAAEERQRHEAMAKEIAEMVSRQASTMDGLSQRLGDVNQQLINIERMVTEDNASSATIIDNLTRDVQCVSNDVQKASQDLQSVNDRIHEVAEEVHVHRFAVEQLQAGMIAVTDSLRQLQQQQEGVYTEGQQWKLEIQQQLRDLSLIVTEIKDKAAEDSSSPIVDAVHNLQQSQHIAQEEVRNWQYRLQEQLEALEARLHHLQHTSRQSTDDSVQQSTLHAVPSPARVAENDSEGFTASDTVNSSRSDDDWLEQWATPELPKTDINRPEENPSGMENRWDNVDRRDEISQRDESIGSSDSEAQSVDFSEQSTWLSPQKSLMVPTDDTLFLARQSEGIIPAADLKKNDSFSFGVPPARVAKDSYRESESTVPLEQSTSLLRSEETPTHEIAVEPVDSMLFDEYKTMLLDDSVIPPLPSEPQVILNHPNPLEENWSQGSGEELRQELPSWWVDDSETPAGQQPKPEIKIEEKTDPHLRVSPDGRLLLGELTEEKTVELPSMEHRSGESLDGRNDDRLADSGYQGSADKEDESFDAGVEEEYGKFISDQPSAVELVDLSELADGSKGGFEDLISSDGNSENDADPVREADLARGAEQHSVTDSIATAPNNDPDAEEDFSVENYMQQLLARMRGEANTTTQSSSSSSSSSFSSSFSSSSLDSAGQRNAKDLETRRSSPVLELSSQHQNTTAWEKRLAQEMGNRERVSAEAASPMDWDTFASLSKATDKLQNMGQLRDLANSSARTAIHRSVRRRHLSGGLLKLAICIVGLTVAAMLFAINGLELNIGLVAAAASLLVAVIWGYDSLISLRMMLKGNIGGEAAKADAATAPVTGGQSGLRS